jgi:pilus assembly protein Flp/PilA
MLGLMQALSRNKKGATAIEYGLIAALVVVAMIGALSGIANVTVGMWNDVANKVQAAN